MPVYTPPFSISEFNAFHTRTEAAEAVKNADPHIHERLRELIKKYQLQRRFGIALVYKHFDLQPGQVLLFDQFVTAEFIDPKVIRDIELYGEAKYGDGSIRPIAWAMTSSNKLMPYQFIRFPNNGTYPVDPRYHAWQDFMYEFMHEVEWAELRPFIGLKLIQVTDRHDLVSRHDQIADPPRSAVGERRPRSRTPSPGPRRQPRRERMAQIYLSTPLWRERVAKGEITPEELGLKQEDFDNYKDRSTSPDTPPPKAAAGERLGTPTEEAAEERREALADDDE